jgi:UDP-glucose 4-epimerase
MKVLVTGGAGYIGSHTCLELLKAGHDVTIYDNFANSSVLALDRLTQLTNRTFQTIRGDIRDDLAMEAALRSSRAEAVIHFAGLKAVGESVQLPLEYYDVNVAGTLTLLQAMMRLGVGKIVFSSSATVYGDPEVVPIPETHPLRAASPYGRTKLVVEEVLRDFHRARPDSGVAILRYFNPVGAHESGRIGEDPAGHPNNLMPYITQVAVGRRDRLTIWGNDYPTPDGTGVRDYIHVVDLAVGHVRALEKLSAGTLLALNLGTGRGSSVLEMIAAFEKASGRRIPYTIGPRRPGDVAACYADTSLAEELLGWKAERGLDEMCEDSWRWQSRNPYGYQAPQKTWTSPRRRTGELARAG